MQDWRCGWPHKKFPGQLCNKHIEFGPQPPAKDKRCPRCRRVLGEKVIAK